MPAAWEQPPASYRRVLRVPNTLLLRAMTTQKYVAVGAGSTFCGSVNSGQSSSVLSFRLCSPHTPAFPTLSVVSVNWGGTLFKALGRNNMHLRFSAISARVPKTLVRTWRIHAFVFTLWWPLMQVREIIRELKVRHHTRTNTNKNTITSRMSRSVFIPTHWCTCSALLHRIDGGDSGSNNHNNNYCFYNCHYYYFYFISPFCLL